MAQKISKDPPEKQKGNKCKMEATITCVIDGGKSEMNRERIKLNGKF